MNDLYCPYCEESQTINHDDGYGYDENEMHFQDCKDCNKTFGYETAIIYHYEPVKVPCQNEAADHRWKASFTFPVDSSFMRCADCQEIRKPTQSEQAQIEKDWAQRVAK